jgi:O-6-methylguanine DNA methyltransferase
MQCRSVLTRIDAVRTTELRAAEVREVEGHLASCPSCKKSVEDIEAFAALIRSCTTTPERSLARTIVEAVEDRFDSFETGGHRVFVAFSRRGVRMIDLRARTPGEFRRAYQERFGRELCGEPLSPRDREAVEASLRGQPARRPAIDLSDLTEFEQNALRTIGAIPRGEVRTYEWVARAVGRPKAVRAVGNVMATNPIPFLLPCHRVVPTSGGIGNYAFGAAMKRSLLAAEGTPVEELEALSERGVRYIGSRTTEIFCFPTCRDARRIRAANRIEFHGSKEARDHGYRPCKRCTPVVAA